MFFDDFDDLLRVVVVGTLAYVALIAFLRISGKRTLSQLNAFDFVVTVALGSTLATVLLSTEVSLAEGALALGLLIGLQYVIAFTAVHNSTVQKLIKSEPRLLLYEGQFLDSALRRERVTRDEVVAVLRESGVPTVEQAFAVVIETNGTFSVTTSSGDLSRTSSLKHVARDGVQDYSPP